MKQILFLSAIALCVSCGETKKEEAGATTGTQQKKYMVTCDSVVTEDINTKTGISTFLKILKCDSTLIEEPAK